MSWLFLLASTIALLNAFNAHRPRYRPAWLAGVSFFAGWLTAELSLHHLAVQLIITGGFILAGGLSAWPGQLALLLAATSWLLLLLLHRRAFEAKGVLDRALDEAFSGHGAVADAANAMPEETVSAALDWRPLIFPFNVAHPDVELIRDLIYYQEGRLKLRLDVRRPRQSETPSQTPPQTSALRPALIYVHGGAWVLGDKKQQGLPVMSRLAARGWVCFAINYRLSPRATFPDHIIDVKRAIAWVRAHAADYQVDPSLIVIAGNSAGGHLASLAALTPNDPEYQPGFESADTHVSACMSFYGVYDFTDRHGVWPNPGLSRLLERQVMKASLHDNPNAFEKASPIARINPDAPPFLVIHGDADSLVPIQQARHFVTALRQSSGQPVAFAEVPGAQHAFEVFPSVRTLHTLRAVDRYADWLVARKTAR